MARRLVIGTGGFGIILAKQVFRLSEDAHGAGETRLLAVDMEGVEGIRPEDQFSLATPPMEFPTLSDWSGGLTNALTAIRFGAAANAESGRRAQFLHEEALLRWFSEIIKDAGATDFRVLIVGSLVGGTSSGLLPGLGSLVRKALSAAGTRGDIIGTGLDTSFFQNLAPLGLERTFERNQQQSFQWLQQELQSGPPNGYDAFYVLRAPRKMEREEAIRRAADRLLEIWDSTGFGDAVPGSLVGSEIGEGILLFALSHPETPDLEVLWGPGTHILGTSASETQYEIFFHVPIARSRWAEQIRNFRKLIRKPKVTESELQAFLERYPLFLTGFDYQRVQPQVHLYGKNKDLLIPDFMLVPFDNSLADIVELKRPQDRLLAWQGKHARFSAEVTAAIAQLRDYEQYFDDEENRERILADHGFSAYKPRLSLIIGSSSMIDSPIVFRKVASDWRQVSLLTYDDVLAKAERLLQIAFQE